MASLVVEAKQRAQTRQWQIEDRDLARADRQAEREQDRVEASQAAGIAWASGDVTLAEAGGVEEKHFNRIALSEFRNVNYDGIARGFRVSHFVSPAIKNDIEARITGSLDEQYGKNIEAEHQRWQAMYKVNPGMTAAYYGDWNEKMRTFDTLSRAVGPQAAYTRAFGDTSATARPACRLSTARRRTRRSATQSAQPSPRI